MPYAAVYRRSFRIPTAIACICTLLLGCTTDTPETDPAPAPTTTSAERPEIPNTWEDATAGTTFEEMVEQIHQEGIELGKELVKMELLSPDSELDIPIVRVVTLAESGTARAACIAEAGFVVHVFADTSMQADDVPPEQGKALNYAVHRCMMQYPINPYQQMPIPREPALRLYHHWIDVSTPCLEEQGIHVPEPPSEQTWLDHWATSPETAWSPYTLIDGNPDPQTRDRLYRACPREPEGLWPAIP